MEPAAGGVFDFFGDGSGEGDDIMIERFLQFFLAGNEAGQVGEPFVRAGFDFGEVGPGHDALLDERLAGEEFDLEPDAELVFVGPDGPHFRSGIARDHGARVKRRESRVEPLSLRSSAPRS